MTLDSLANMGVYDDAQGCWTRVFVGVPADHEYVSAVVGIMGIAPPGNAKRVHAPCQLCTDYLP